MQHQTEDGQTDPENDRPEFGKVETMNVAALEKDRGRDVHKDTDNKSHEFPRVHGQGSMGAYSHSQRSHRGEQTQICDGEPALHPALHQHPEQGDRHREIMQHDAPEQ